MEYFIGNYFCKIDTKNRLAIPSGLKQQLPGDGKDPLVINKGRGGYLDIFTKAEWKRQLDTLMELNQYSRENREFIRRYTNSAIVVEPDGAGRLLIPKFLCDHAGLNAASAADVVLSCQPDRIELWEEKAHAASLEEDYDMDAKIEELLGGLKKGGANE
ncbi:MraZ protein [Mucilaginibacter yixingensis]|uniref:Transcriptional regulator MraZ n=1 Tax=Mucilaginibacter yixingensis TaxID=1295612 RepID=A0A2T5J789_9SPHI|nr:division/cell wall cluster transcriptional repressor MraZ [Mucilaginibacter yixingensis]PTQ95017.1 MraZ protein [Mucilaginibacter yixingensis]